MFPLGDMNKHQTRMIADQQNFYNADKPDSQDICFVPDGDYAGFIRRFTGKDYPAGDFTDKDGNVLGHHKGIIGYTVGQRKGAWHCSWQACLRYQNLSGREPRDSGR